MTGKIGRIQYTNAKPFYFNWPAERFPLVNGSPRGLAQKAKAGEIDAAPLPVTETWELESHFQPLANYGIATKQASNSVFLLSKKPLAFLSGTVIGVTDESSTSVALLKVLLNHKHGYQFQCKQGFSPSDDAWLVIGDSALKYWLHSSPQWAVVTDLAMEWWQWKKLPFVFAKWVVKKDWPEEKIKILETTLEECLEKGLANLPNDSRQMGNEVGLTPHRILQYIQGFNYRLGPKEKESMELFQELSLGVLPGLALSAR